VSRLSAPDERPTWSAELCVHMQPLSPGDPRHPGDGEHPIRFVKVSIDQAPTLPGEPCAD
jgi:hypothetical protein